MPRFKCNTKDCPNRDVVELIPRVRYVFDTESRKLVSKEAICKHCGKQREQLLEGSLTQMPWFKAQNDRNYNNKEVKQYDYDKENIH
jgi:hypothetical protein